ncbi:AAA domain-containing protein [Phakopsora pachyrhizi]|nr:AAA domain-containing protein [Phakopsora pachyrhizi]
MSSIDKIAIRGIRSFDSQSIAVMQFYSPLTVIVGQNGSGKTTIIECLKYITTGDLPPNTKGGAFVHDPGMAGESTVMAEVLLRFKNAAGTKLVASRRLQVSRRKNAGLTMKTLEGTLSYHDDKRSTQNSKLQTSIDRITASISSKEDEYNRLDEKIIELVESNKAFYDGALKYKEIQNRHSTIESQRENKLKIVKDLLEDIDEIKGGKASYVVFFKHIKNSNKGLILR